MRLRMNISDALIRMPKIIETHNGYEVLSNDNKIKVILQQNLVFTGTIETELYTAHYYVKDDTGWIKANMSHTYESKQDFIRSIRQADAFSQAINELREALGGEHSDDRPHGESYPYHYADDR